MTNGKLLALDIYNDYLSSLKKFNEASVGVYFMPEDGEILDNEICRVLTHISNLNKAEALESSARLTAFIRVLRCVRVVVGSSKI
jgi:hypothetical protein